MICNDSYGNRIYAGDTVELFIGIETRTAWKSVVHWNMLDGAFVDSHPAHRKMGLSSYKNLREFLGRDDWHVENMDGEIEILKTYCKKIKK